MNISSINNYNYSNAYNSNQSFKSCNRIYNISRTLPSCKNFSIPIIETSTSFFCNELNWPDIPELLVNNFKEKSKVNFHCLACSDGSEPNSYAMLILDKIPKEIQSKFLPIKASDIDEEIIRAAKSGYINITNIDIERIFKNINISINDMFRYCRDKLKIKDDTYALVPAFQDITYKVINNELANSVNYNQADLIDAIKDIEDDGNTVISCRKVFFYFSKDYRRRFFETLGNTLKQNSLFIISQKDTMGKAHKYLEEIGFTEIAPNVYRKN